MHLRIAVSAALLVSTFGSGASAQRPNPLVSLLDEGQVVFGVFSGEQTPQQARRLAGSTGADFVLYSLERGPFDMVTMTAFIEALEVVRPIPVALRVPPVGTDREGATKRVEQALQAGARSIVFPHVESAGEASFAVRLPTPPVPAMLIVEDRRGVDNVAGIASAEGVDVVFAGPGDLRRAYDGDMAAVEAAIQKILAACRAARTPCGITAGPSDIAVRIQQGFRVIIATGPEAEAAVEIGKKAAGR